MTNEIVDVTPEPVNRETALATMRNPPSIVMIEAKRACEALTDVISKKPKKVMMNGKQYLEFEDWQLAARFYGITAMADGEPEVVAVGEAQGFKASAVAVNAEGRIISRATAYCLNDEEKWSARTKYEWHYVLRDGSTQKEDPGKDGITWVPRTDGKSGNVPKKERVEVGVEQVPMFQLCSMAQTRACAKALRNVLSWVVVLAGYATTPAEEIDGMHGATTTDDGDQGDRPAPRPAAKPAQPSPSRNAAAPAPAQNPTQKPQQKPEPIPCPGCGNNAAFPITAFEPRDGRSHYCSACGVKFDPKNPENIG